MYYLVVTFAWAIGVLSFAQFLTVDPAAADIFDAETTAKRLNVRSGPGTTHEVVATVPNGTRVSILEIDDGWTRIVAVSDQKALDGWVSGEYLELYEIAVPLVASAGIDESETSDTSQPAFEQEPDIAVVEDAPLVEEIADEVVVSDVADSDDATEISDQVTTAADTTSTQQLAVQQSDDAAAEVEAEVMASLDGSIEQDAGAESESPASLTEETTDVQISSVASDIVEPQPVLTEAAKPLEAPDTGPLTFEALDISCRKSYFSDALEACVTDIKIDIAMPEDVANSTGDTLNVKCDVGYNYEVAGNLRSESTSEVVNVILAQGRGSAVLESRIDFLFRVDGVSRVELADINCGAVSD